MKKFICFIFLLTFFISLLHISKTNNFINTFKNLEDVSFCFVFENKNTEKLTKNLISDNIDINNQKNLAEEFSIKLDAKNLLDKNYVVSSLLKNNNLIKPYNLINQYKENLTNKNTLKILKNGSKIFVYSKKEEHFNTEPDYIQIEGQIDKTNLSNLLNKINAQKVLNETYEDKQIAFYYVPLWKKYKIINEQKVNLQIVKSQLVTLGYPAIYGSF